MSAETRAAIDAAIHAHAQDEWGGSLVADWILVAGLVDGDATNSIGIECSRDSMPAYISTGLLTEALNVDPSYAIDADDED